MLIIAFPAPRRVLYQTTTMRTLFPLALCSLNALSAAALSATTVELVKERLKDAAQKSWELGTRSQALLELEAPSVSVFTATSIPGSPAALSAGNLTAGTKIPNAAKLAFTSGELDDVLGISHQILTSQPKGSLPLMKDGSSADPASNGVAILVANWTEAQGGDFSAAAEGQLTWLLSHVPRSSKGAISHRNSEVQLWSDYIYMVPPFLAYYGASTSNATLVAEAYNQIKLYRDVLLDKPTGLWQHIRQGSFEDKKLWTTGNGWAAMGMLRVAATIRASGYESDFTDEMNDLKTWTNSIFTSIWPYLTEENLFYNYAEKDNTFLDAAGTTLIAASVYRAATLFGLTEHVPYAEKIYATIGGVSTNPTNSTSTSASSQPSSTPARRHRAARDTNAHHRVQLSHLHHPRASKHITSDGWLTPVVNPHSFSVLGEKSAEGQAFVVMMYAARNDYLASQSKTSGAAKVIGTGTSGGAGAGLVGVGNVGAQAGSGSGSNSTTEETNGAGRLGVGMGVVLGAMGALVWAL